MKRVLSINYDKAITQADRISEAKEKCEHQVSELKKIIQLLSENWNGDSGNAMIEKCNEWITRQLEQANRLDNVEYRIRTTVERIRKADEEASEFIES